MKWRSHPRFAIAAPQPFPTNVLLVPMMRAVRSGIASAIILAFAWVSFCSQSCFAPDLTASSCPYTIAPTAAITTRAARTPLAFKISLLFFHP